MMKEERRVTERGCIAIKVMQSGDRKRICTHGENIKVEKGRGLDRRSKANI